MKVIFLDIDGVLSTEEHVQSLTSKAGAESVLRGPAGFDVELIEPELCERLNLITDATGAKIVVTSVWRQLHPWATLIKMLALKGVTGEIIAKTPNGGRTRGHEIKMWLDKHPEVTHFVILETKLDVHPFEDWMVQTRYWGDDAGLQQMHVKRAIRMLKEVEQDVD